MCLSWDFACLNCVYTVGRTLRGELGLSVAKVSWFLCCSFKAELRFLLEFLVFAIKAQRISLYKPTQFIEGNLLFRVC